MSRRRVVIIWTLYSLCAVFFLLLQSWLLDRIVIWGVHPFIVPFLAILPAISEKRQQALIFAFVLGLFCDFVMPVFIPCFYCIILPLLAFLTHMISRRVIMSKILCGTLTCSGSLLCINFCHTLYVLYLGRAALLDALILCGKELLLSIPVLPLLFLAYFNLRRYIATS